MKSASINGLCLLFLLTGVEAHAFDVAVVEAAGSHIGGGTATVAQLNDDTFFDFTATLLDPSEISSVGDLAAYDVVVLGGTGHGIDPVWTVAMANALKEFVENGGGVIMTGFGLWNALSGGSENAEPAAILDTFIPGDIYNVTAWSWSCCSLLASIELMDLNHPITQNLPTSVEYGEGCCLEYNMHPLQPGDVALGVPNPQNSGPGYALIYREDIGAGSGRSVYLGAPHLGDIYSNPYFQPGLRNGPGDQLFEQAVAWVASGGGVDADSTDADSTEADDADGDGLDTDGDGVFDVDDYCPGTMIPEGVPTVNLKPNHWAFVDNDATFDTMIKGRGKGPNRSYTLEDTAGCSCEQIIDAQGLGYGHMKHGCSIGVMDYWVELVTP